MRCAVMFGGVVCIFLLHPHCCFSQDPYTNDNPLNIPAHLFDKIQRKTTGIDQQLTRQTKKMLLQECSREEKLRRKLYKVDSFAAKRLFDPAISRYRALLKGFENNPMSGNQATSGEYQPNTDSLRSVLLFLQKHPNLLSERNDIPVMQNSLHQFQVLQGNFQFADQVKSIMKDQRQQIGAYLSQHVGMVGLLGKGYQGINQDLFYYSQRVNQYKELLNNPDALEKRALAMLNQVPAFQAFMKNNSQLAGLFNLPGNYGTPQALQGLQTRDQVSQLIQSQVATGGAGGGEVLQANLQSAETQLNGFKDKLNQLGNGSGDIDMPNFKPNDQKMKTFWKRLEYGVNFQTTSNTTYYPTMTDLGLSLGYKLGHSNSIGMGLDWKVGWGSGWNHIAFSSNGLGIRSFADIRLKGSLSFTGGFEYNYIMPITSLQNIDHLSYWIPSGLAGLTKTLPIKNRLFKKTKLSLLWDFLSYQQKIAKTQPFLFRIGYTFN